MYLILAVRDGKHLLLSSAESAVEALAAWSAASAVHGELVIGDGSVGPIDHAELVRRAEAEQSDGEVPRISA